MMAMELHRINSDQNNQHLKRLVNQNETFLDVNKYSDFFMKKKTPKNIIPLQIRRLSLQILALKFDIHAHRFILINWTFLIRVRNIPFVIFSLYIYLFPNGIIPT